MTAYSLPSPGSGSWLQFELPTPLILMISVVSTYCDQALETMSAVVCQGAPSVSTPAGAAGLIGGVERVRRLAAVAAVDVLAQIESSRAFYEYGHANARVMFAHVAGVSGAEAYRLDKIRRMIGAADQIAEVWRAGGLSVDKAAVLGRAFANPRSRDRFLHDQR